MAVSPRSTRTWRRSLENTRAESGVSVARQTGAARATPLPGSDIFQPAAYAPGGRLLHDEACDGSVLDAQPGQIGDGDLIV